MPLAFLSLKWRRLTNSVTLKQLQMRKEVKTWTERRLCLFYCSSDFRSWQIGEVVDLAFHGEKMEMQKE